MPITELNAAIRRLPQETRFAISITPVDDPNGFPNIHGEIIRNRHGIALHETTHEVFETEPQPKPTTKKRLRKPSPVVK